MNTTPYTPAAIDPQAELAGEAFSHSSDTDAQLWSQLTLSSLRKQLEGRESDPEFSSANELVEKLSNQFAAASPIEIADYFEAVQAVDRLKHGGVDSLADLEGPNLTAL